MNFRKIAKFSSLLLAFILLLSSTGLSLDLHYCQGDIKSFSLFGVAKSCCAKAEKSHCSKKKMTCHSSQPADEKLSDLPGKCCSNKTIVVSPDMDSQKVISEQLTETQITFVSAFLAVFYAPQNLSFGKLIIPHLNYIPPLLDQDISVLIQSFLL